MMKKILFSALLVAFTLNAQQKPFRFAWLTDTHVGSATGEEDLRRSVRDINAMSDIAFVVHSGDVTEMGSTRELALAKSVMDSLRVPYYIIPGNHDVKWSESGCSAFPRLWKDDKFTFEYGGVRFIACSSGPNMRQGDGHVPEEDVRWLDSITTSVKKSGRPVIFINHYPLDEQLDNWYEVTDRIKSLHTIAALCGHGHANRPLDFEGVPGVMGRSNLRAQRAVGGYTIVAVDQDSLSFFERTPALAVNDARGADTSAAGGMRRWHAIANIPHPYASDPRAYKRPDYSVNRTYPFVREVWNAHTGYTIGASPAVAGRTVITGNNKGYIEGYDIASGRKRWSLKTNGSVYSTAAVAPVKKDGRTGTARTRNALRVVVGSADGTIYCIDPDRGSVFWKHEATGPIVASPAIRDRAVYIGSSDGTFRALSLETGKSLWEYAGVEGFVESTPLVYRGKVIFGAWDTYLYALDQQTGALLWKWSNGKPTRNLSPAACTPVASGGKVFVVAPDRFTAAIDAETGTALWRTNAHQVREMIGISEDTMTVYVRTMNDSLIALSPLSASPDVRWSLDCKYGYDFAPSMPVEKDGSVFFGTKNGLVYCVDARTHRVAWVHKIGNTVINTVKPLSASEVVVTSMDGSLVRLRAAR